MKISTSPRVIIYTDYTECSIREALLHALQTAKNNVLTLPQIWNIRVNWNRITWSYWHAKMQLVRKGYNIENKKELVDWIMCSTYTLKNPTFSPEDVEIRAYFSN